MANKIEEKRMKIIKHVMICVCVSIVLFVLAVGDIVLCAQEKKQELSEADKKAQELMEEYAAPGENHKFLDYFVGEWESLVKYYSEPGAEPFIYKEQITVKWILGGRFTRAVLKGNLLGREYEVFVYNGYDNYKKEFFSIQLSTLNTGYYSGTGSLDKSGKIRTDTSVFDDPTEGKVNTKAVTTLLDRNTYRYEFYIVDDKGKETLVMEVVYNRK
jgi:hypothetical protein